MPNSSHPESRFFVRREAILGWGTAIVGRGFMRFTALITGIFLLFPTRLSASPRAAQQKSSTTSKLDGKSKKLLHKDLDLMRKALQNDDVKSMQPPLEHALQLVRERAPLQLAKLTVLQQSPRGLGMFTASPQANVHDGKLQLYVEVRNFVSSLKNGEYKVDLSTDAAFYYADGSFIARKNNIGRHSFVSSTRHDVTFMVIDLNLRGMPAQAYQVEVIVHDNNSAKTQKLRCDFNIL